MVDHAAMRLGKKLARVDLALPLLSDFTADMPAAPAAVDYGSKVSDFGMMRNNALGDCTCAASGHLVQLWTALNGHEFVPSDADIVAMYAAVSGYVPGDESTDNGAVVLDVLHYWHDTGLDGRRLDAFARIQASDHEMMRKGIWLFGGVYLGVELPLTAQDQDTWDVVRHAGGRARPGSWGGHAIPAVSFDSGGVTVVTWGKLLKVTWAFLDRYCSEAYAPLSQDWADSDGAPSGFSFDALRQDMQQIQGRRAA